MGLAAINALFTWTFRGGRCRLPVANAAEVGGRDGQQAGEDAEESSEYDTDSSEVDPGMLPTPSRATYPAQL
jgi:hypothetical protein